VLFKSPYVFVFTTLLYGCPQEHLSVKYNILYIVEEQVDQTFTLSLHDALPISCARCGRPGVRRLCHREDGRGTQRPRWRRKPVRSEEHTSELQSRFELVCRLLLEKIKVKDNILYIDGEKVNKTFMEHNDDNTQE